MTAENQVKITVEVNTRKIRMMLRFYMFIDIITFKIFSSKLNELCKKKCLNIVKNKKFIIIK